ncbi:MAG: phospholipase D-like domain-containing protein [Thermodesulfobacteriota bacterium]
MGFETARFKSAHRRLITMGLLWAAGMLFGCMPSLPDGDRLTIICPAECNITFANNTRGLPIDNLLKSTSASEEELRDLKRFIRVDQAITGRPLYSGNQVRLLIDGPMAYEAMFKAMRNATHHIHLETFILEDEEIGQEFAEILIERRQAGVEVRMVYDAFGILNAEDAFFDRLREHGIQTYKFNPLDPTENLQVWQMNERHHRKILVVDGRVAFAGGMNISSVYTHTSFSPPMGMSKLKDRWRDTHLRLDGPVVAQLQTLFLTLWAKLHETAPLAGPEYFPDLAPAGSKLVRVVVSAAGDEEVDIYKVFLAAFHQAESRIWITQGYFSPDQRFLNVLKNAARRGVDVRLLLPGATDSWITISSSRAHYSELLKAGVKIFERKDALQHAKSAVVDGIWSTVGSSNLDYRSFLHANEANVVIYGSEFASRMEDMFRADQKENVEITPADWKKRSLIQRSAEILGSMFDYWL